MRSVLFASAVENSRLGAPGRSSRLQTTKPTAIFVRYPELFYHLLPPGKRFSTTCPAVPISYLPLHSPSCQSLCSETPLPFATNVNLFLVILTLFILPPLAHRHTYFSCCAKSTQIAMQGGAQGEINTLIALSILRERSI